MAREQWTIQADWPEQVWWNTPDLVLTLLCPEVMDYAVSVEFKRDEAGAPFVIGVSVRRHVGADGWLGEPTHVAPRDIQRLPLARMIGAALAAAATAPLEKPVEELPQELRELGWELGAAPDRPGGGPVYYDADKEWRSRGYPIEPAWTEDARKILVPRGRPQRGRSTAWYRELAESYRAFARAGYASPVREIAARKRVSENTVHQWVHRARKLGFLEPSPRSRLDR